MTLNKATNERLWDAVITEALRECAEREIAKLENAVNSTENSSVFSAEFEKSISKISNSIGKKERSAQLGKSIFRMAVGAAAVMGIAFGGLLTQPEVAASVSGVVRNVFGDHDSISIHSETPADPQPVLIMPGYVPRGYTLESMSNDEYSGSMSFVSADGDSISFSYILDSNLVMNVDNEHQKCREITRNGRIYLFYEGIDVPMNMVIWNDGTYLYTLIGTLGEDELMKTAESVKL